MSKIDKDKLFKPEEEPTIDTVKRLIAYSEELEKAVYDKNRAIIERDEEIERLKDLGREYLRDFTSEKASHEETADRLSASQDDILILVRQLTLTIRHTKYTSSRIL